MDFDEILIEEVRKNEILYNIQDHEYRKVDKKDKIWIEIASRLNSTPENCRKRWKGLRDTYKRYRRQDCLRSGSAAPEIKRKWKYLELLTFLNEYGVSRPTDGNFASQEDTVMDFSWDVSNICHPTVPGVNLKREEIAISEPAKSKFLENGETNEDLRRASTSSTSTLTSGRIPPISRSRVSSKRRQDFRKKIADFMNMATKNISDACQVQPKDSTTMLFGALAEKIKDANLPKVTVNELEAEVFNIVYSTIARHTK